MKKMLLALAAAAAFSGSAYAADLPARMPMKAAPPPAPVVNWTGCWISGGGGYGLFRVNHDERFTSFRTGLPGGVVNSTVGGDGWLGTGGVGCDYQFSSRWVAGLFADGSFTDIRGDGMARIRGTGDVLVGELKSDWNWAVGGRLGYLVTPGFLTYVNGGYTQAHFNQQNFNTGFIPSVATGLALPGQTFDGVFFGTGVEYGFDWLPGLFLRSEGRAAWYTRKDAIPFCANAGSVCAGPALTTPGAGTGITDSRRPIIYTSKMELVYRFNWGGPVVARY
jgi:outer membrane immunogenic protein